MSVPIPNSRYINKTMVLAERDYRVTFVENLDVNSYVKPEVRTVYKVDYAQIANDILAYGRDLELLWAAQMHMAADDHNSWVPSKRRVTVGVIATGTVDDFLVFWDAVREKNEPESSFLPRMLESRKAFLTVGQAKPDHWCFPLDDEQSTGRAVMKVTFPNAPKRGNMNAYIWVREAIRYYKEMVGSFPSHPGVFAQVFESFELVDLPMAHSGWRYHSTEKMLKHQLGEDTSGKACPACDLYLRAPCECEAIAFRNMRRANLIDLLPDMQAAMFYTVDRHQEERQRRQLMIEQMKKGIGLSDNFFEPKDPVASMLKSFPVPYELKPVKTDPNKTP